MTEESWPDADPNAVGADGSKTRFVPAAGRRSLTRLYDPVIAVTMRERTFRSRFLQQITSELPDGARIVDVGCGTGTLAIELARLAPGAAVIGIDPDPAILQVAERKPGAERVEWRRGSATSPLLEPGSADRVLMSLVLHHLGPEEKVRALRQAAQALGSAGRLHVADWGAPQDPIMRLAFFGLRLLDGFANTRDHAAGRLPSLIKDSGLTHLRTHDRLRTAWGSLELISARSASGAARR